VNRIPAVLATFGFLISALSSAAQSGVIRGTVVDEAGRAIQAAKVRAELHGVPMAKAIRYVETDKNGAFAIDRLAYGVYDVNGKKEEDGYADTSIGFYADKPLASVHLSPDHPVAIVTLKFGPRAATLSGTVRDARTRKPVPAVLTLRHTDNPRNFLAGGVGPVFRTLIPASTEVTVEVSARGYEPWFYPNGSKPSPLRLASGAQMALDIFLQSKRPDGNMNTNPDD
jgi:hypothetical protein